MEEETKATLKEKIDSLKLAIKWTYKSSPGLTILIFAVAIFSGLITILEPYMFKIIIDNLSLNELPSFATRLGLGLVGILIIYGVARGIQSILWDIQMIIKKVHSHRLDQYSARELMSKVSGLDALYFEDAEYHNTLTKANQNLWRVNEFFWQFTFFTSELISIAVIIGAVFAFNPLFVALIILGSLPSLFLIMKSTNVAWSAFDQGSPISRHAHYYKTIMTEKPNAIKEIRLFGLRDHFLNKFEELFGTFRKKQERAAKLQASLLVAMSVIEGTILIFTLWLVIQSFHAGKVTIGDVAFLWVMIFQFSGHVRWVIRTFGHLDENVAFVIPFIKIMNFTPTIKEKDNAIQFPTQLKKGIEFKNASFSYPNSKYPALKNLNLTIKPGENIALVGENGSGKTTLVKLLTRLYDVTEGEILIDGINIKEYSIESIHKNMGIIFQDFMKYEALVEENISYGDIGRKQRSVNVKDSAKKSGAWEFIKDLENEYKTHLGKTLKDKGTELSVGQWQKIALARAFFKDAPILILDEPTAAVDAKAEYELFKKFESLTKDKTTFLISHRFSTVRMANKIIVIDKGKIVEQGNHQELLRKNGQYAKLFTLQAKGYK